MLKSRPLLAVHDVKNSLKTQDKCHFASSAHLELRYSALQIANFLKYNVSTATKTTNNKSVSISVFLPETFVYTSSIHFPVFCHFHLIGQTDAKDHSDPKFILCHPLLLVLPV